MSKVLNMVGGGLSLDPLSDPASAADIRIGKKVYNDQGIEITGSLPNGTATGPNSISESSATLSTDTNTLTLTKTGVNTTPIVSAGYVSGATSSTATVNLTTSVTTTGATTYTPGTSDQTIVSGTYLTGTQTILGDSNLISGNIKKNINLFGVTGSYEGLELKSTSDYNLTNNSYQLNFTAQTEPVYVFITYWNSSLSDNQTIVECLYNKNSSFVSFLYRNGSYIIRSAYSNISSYISYTNNIFTVYATQPFLSINYSYIIYYI